MELKSYARDAPSINLSALIDIIFILLIFVVLAANFQRIRSIDIELPEASASGAIEETSLTLLVTKQGTVKLEDREIEMRFLRDELTMLKARYKTAVLVADQETALKHAVSVLSDAQAAGFDSVQVATKGAAE